MQLFVVMMTLLLITV